MKKLFGLILLAFMVSLFVPVAEAAPDTKTVTLVKVHKKHRKHHKHRHHHHHHRKVIIIRS